MSSVNQRWLLLVATAIAIAAVVLLVPPIASANQTHRVRAGQTLAQIADHYGVTITSLAGANAMSPDDVLRAGQVLQIPERGETYVAPGQTLSHIAHANGVSIRALARANRLGPNATLRVGQRLILPGHERSTSRPESTREYGRPSHPGRAILTNGRERKLITLVDRRGRARAAAINQLARLMRYQNTPRTLRPPPRLVQILARVSDHFGGRPILIVSGYRPAGGYTRESSRHTRGHAVDIRVEGVANEELRDYCRAFEDTGVGYYPNSSFVHLDVRERSTYWVDYSGPGERPRYHRATEPPSHDDAAEAHADSEHEPNEAELPPNETAAAASAGPESVTSE